MQNTVCYTNFTCLPCKNLWKTAHSTVAAEVKVFFKKKTKQNIIPFDSLILNAFDSPAVSLL